MLLLSSNDSFAQTMTVLVIFVAVLGVTALVTKWMAGYQREASAGRNVEIIETSRLANNKWIQIVRVGETYKVVAIGKDTVTYMGEVSESELKLQTEGSKQSFQSKFEEILHQDKNSSSEEKEKPNEHE